MKPGEAQPGVPATGTLVSLVFTGGDQNQQKRAKQAVEELLKNDLGPDTWIGVFRLGLQLWTVQPFTKDLALVRQAVDKAASSADQALAEPDQAARTGVAEALAQLQQGKGDPAAISRAEVLGKIMRQGDRLLRQQQEGSPLYFLMALAKGQATAPGRKSVLYFTGGLTVSGLLSDFFKSTQSEANRAHVSFYAIDVGGLDTWSEARSRARRRSPDVRQDRISTQPARGPVAPRPRDDRCKLGDRAEASTRTNWKQPLKELSENTGGFAVLDTNDYKKPMERLASDLGGFYEITYAPANPAFDGAFRKTEVKVAARRHEGSRTATATSRRRPTTRARSSPTSCRCSTRCRSAEPKQDFPITAGAFRFGSSAEGRDVFLVAELPMSKLKFTTDPKTKTYKMHFALLAVVKDAQGKVVERVSQDYPFQGPADKLPQLQQGNVIFKRRVVVPAGPLHGRDRRAGPRRRRDERAADAAARSRRSTASPLSSVVVIRRMEHGAAAAAGRARRTRCAARRCASCRASTIPIQKATTPKLPIYLVVYPARGRDGAAADDDRVLVRRQARGPQQRDAAGARSRRPHPLPRADPDRAGSAWARTS